MKKFKFLSFILLFVLSLFILVSCGNEEGTNTTQSTEVAYGDWEIIQAPTANAAGKARRKTADASTAEEKELPALGDDYTKEVVKVATCKEKGSEKYTLKSDTSISFTVETQALAHEGDLFCTRCGESVKDDTFYANALDFSKYETVELTATDFEISITSTSGKERTFDVVEAKILIVNNEDDSSVYGYYSTYVYDYDENDNKVIKKDEQGNALLDTSYFKYDNGVLYTVEAEGDGDVYYEVNSNSLIKQLLDSLELEGIEFSTASLAPAFKSVLQTLTKGTLVDNNIRVTVDTDKIKSINNLLFTKKISELTGITLEEDDLAFLDKSLTELVTENEGVINEFVKNIDENVLPKVLPLIAKVTYNDELLEMNTLSMLEMLAMQMQLIEDPTVLTTITTVEDLLKAIDQSTEQKKQTVADWIMMLSQMAMQMIPGKKAVANQPALQPTNAPEGQTETEEKTNAEQITALIQHVLDSTVYELVCEYAGSMLSLGSLAKPEVVKALVDSLIDTTIGQNGSYLDLTSEGLIDSGLLTFDFGKVKGNLAIQCNKELTKETPLMEFVKSVEPYLTQDFDTQLRNKIVAYFTSTGQYVSADYDDEWCHFFFDASTASLGTDEFTITVNKYVYR